MNLFYGGNLFGTWHMYNQPGFQVRFLGGRIGHQRENSKKNFTPKNP